jgi:hypothetical protein
MFNAIWDSDMVSNVAFYPQPATQGEGAIAGITRDGVFTIDSEIQIAYRLYSRPQAGTKALVVHFHANAEICTYVSTIAYFHMFYLFFFPFVAHFAPNHADIKMYSNTNTR